MPGTEVKEHSTQEVATFGSLWDLAELELWVMSSPVPGCKQCISWGSQWSQHWQSTWGWWGQLGFLSAEAFQLWCLQSPPTLCKAQRSRWDRGAELCKGEQG